MSLDALPEELVEKVFKYHAHTTIYSHPKRRTRHTSERHTLSVCLRLSRRYYRIGAPLLYEDITFCCSPPTEDFNTTTDYFIPFISFLEEHSMFTRYIKTLTLHGGKAHHGGIRYQVNGRIILLCTLTAIIYHVPSLKSLTLISINLQKRCKPSVRAISHTSPNIPPAPPLPLQLDSLSLTYCSFSFGFWSSSPIPFRAFSTLLQPREVSLVAVHEGLIASPFSDI